MEKQFKLLSDSKLRAKILTFKNKINNIEDNDKVLSFDILLQERIIEDIHVLLPEWIRYCHRYSDANEVPLHYALDFYELSISFHTSLDMLCSILSDVMELHLEKSNGSMSSVENTNISFTHFNIEEYRKSLIAYHENCIKTCNELIHFFMDIRLIHYPFKDHDTWTDDKERKIEEGFFEFYKHNSDHIIKELHRLVGQTKDNRLEETTSEHWANLFSVLDNAAFLAEKEEFDNKHCDRKTKVILDSYLSKIVKIKDFLSIFRRSDYSNSISLPIYDRGFCLLCFHSIRSANIDIMYEYLLTICLIKIHMYSGLKVEWVNFLESNIDMSIKNQYYTDKELAEIEQDITEENEATDDREQYDSALHPMAVYVKRADKAEGIIECMRHFVNGQSSSLPKDLLAPLKAAIDCKPRAVLTSVTLDAYNREFSLDIKEETFKSWIKGNRGTRYEEDDLRDFMDEYERIMNEK